MISKRTEMSVEDHANNIKGMNLTEAQFYCVSADIPCRVTKMDGYYYIVTRDYNTNRLNFVVENGIVIEVTRG